MRDPAYLAGTVEGPYAPDQVGRNTVPYPHAYGKLFRAAPIRRAGKGRITRVRGPVAPIQPGSPVSLRYGAWRSYKPLGCPSGRSLLEGRYGGIRGSCYHRLLLCRHRRCTISAGLSLHLHMRPSPTDRATHSSPLGASMLWMLWELCMVDLCCMKTHTTLCRQEWCYAAYVCYMASNG